MKIIDFSSAASIPRYIEITHRLKHGMVTIGRLLLGPHPGVAIGTAQYTILIQEGAPFEMEWLFPQSRILERKRMEPGNIHIYPSDTVVYKRWHTSSPTLFMAIDRGFIDQIIGKVFDQCSIELKPRIGIRDSVIEGMAEAWREELQERGAGGRIHTEALATALIVHLFRAYGEGKTNLRVTGGMNAVRLRRVFDYVEAHLNEDINLLRLASIAGYSVHHFSEVFKAETGFSPHHFLIGRRVDRAKELLLGSKMSIAEIAGDVGFSGQSHFTLHFRKLTGTTPMRFRSANSKWAE